MSKVLLSEEYLQDIASAIREKLGVTDQYLPSEMAEAILSISGGGGGGFDPSEFTKYLQSDGASWIDTGYIVKDNSRFEVVANVDSTNTQFATLFGTRATPQESASALSCTVFVKYNGASKLRLNWGSSVIEAVSDMPTYCYGQKVLYKLTKGQSYVENGNHAISALPFASTVSATDTYPLYLFNLDEAGHEYGAATRCTAKLYGCKIYEGDTLVMDLVPFIDGSTPCLKDTVSGNMFYNAGAGSFTYGEDA